MKKEQDVCILAHAYQGQEILEVADYMGDSYGLSVQASKSNCKGVIMCGVRFMAETCKVLSPEKKVWLANPTAGCPMAEQLDLESLRKLKAEHPGYAVVAYINTTSELKTECDVCVTSSSAVQICSKLDNDKILFIPDPNLGRFVAEKLPEKEFAFYKGGCPRLMQEEAAFVTKFEESMDDDFNTADALAAVFELVKFANTNVQEGSSKEFAGHTLEVMTKLCDVLGLTLEKKEEILDEEIENLIAERQAARKAKDFARADEIRGLLLDKGIELKDTREGVKWKRI